MRFAKKVAVCVVVSVALVLVFVVVTTQKLASRVSNTLFSGVLYSYPTITTRIPRAPLNLVNNTFSEFNAYGDTLLCPVYSRSCDCLRTHVFAESVCASDEAWKASPKPIVRLAPEGSTWLSGEARRGRFDCPHSRCVWGSESEGAVSVFINSLPPLEPTDAGNFRVLVSFESCEYYPDACNGDKLRTYGYTHLFRPQTASGSITQDMFSYIHTDLASFRLPVVPISEKKKAVAVFISNCGDVASGRITLIKDMINNGINVHSFGSCMHNADIINHAPECASIPRRTSLIDVQKLCIIRTYRFTASLESVVAHDYITEKLFQPLLVGSVPIYLGAPNVQNVLPASNAALLVDNFASPAALFAHVLTLMDDNDAYSDRLRWRNESFALGFRNAVRKQFSSIQCRACDNIALGTHLKLCKPWTLVELPQDSLSLIVLGIAYIPEEARVRILAFAEGFDYFVGEGRVQAYPTARGKELAISIRYRSNEAFVRCAPVEQRADVNHIFCPVEGLPLSSADADWTLRVKRNDNVILPLKLCEPPSHFLPDSISPRIGICVATVYLRHTTIRHLLDFAEYHRAMEVDQVTFLMRRDAYRRFGTMIAAAYPDGSVVAVDYGVSSRDPTNAEKMAGYYDQEMAINHCFMRSRGQVDWLGVFDLDEYFFAPNYPPVHLAIGRATSFSTDVSCLQLHTDRIHDEFVEATNEDGESTLHELHDNATSRDLPTGDPFLGKFFCRVDDFDSAINHLAFPVKGLSLVADSSIAVIRHFSNLFALRRNDIGTFVRSVDKAWARSYGAQVDLALKRAMAALKT